MKIIPVILSGGPGSRLWPLSRKQYPKQYLPLIGNNTMIQETILRLSGLDNLAEPIIVCNEEHRFVVAEQCKQINITNATILLEPISRNTAPAIVAAALQVQQTLEDSILLVLSADHVIKHVNEFHKAIDIASNQAQQGRLAIFGSLPTQANTGYGYIKPNINGKGDVYQVDEFVEKPDTKTAESYLKQGNYLWNSGMFMFQATTLIDELTEYSPQIVRSMIDSVSKSKQDLDFIRLDEESFKLSPADSIDCALFEKSNNVVVVPLDAQWSDIGTWTALYDAEEKDNNGNVIKGDVIATDTTNTYINASHHLVATLGVENLIVVDTPDATFIATQDKAHEVKTLVSLMQASVRDEVNSNRKVYRPWGWFDSVERGVGFQVKRLCIYPHQKLSLQKHYKRAEHWVVICGLATVTNGNQKLTLTAGQSTYVPIQTIHCLENDTNEYLEIIEVQIGDYIGEDDIIRFSDNYNRLEFIN
jgi:mannose-1-phosphate guanylyltransferase / mannose-6-phosphate isomerase